MSHQHLLQHRYVAVLMDLAGELPTSSIAEDVASEILAIRELHDLDTNHARSSAVDVTIGSVIDVVEVAFESFDHCVRCVVGNLIHDLRVLFRTA